MPTPNLLSITEVTPGVLAQAQLATGANTVYTVGASTAALLKTMTLCNTSAAAVTLDVSVTKSGGTARKVVSGYVLAAGDTTTVTELAGIFLGEGDIVGANASAGAAVDVLVTGLETS